MKPLVIVYNAVSLDGRTTGFPVDLGLFYGIAAGFHEDATLAGADTLLAATPPDAGGETSARAPVARRAGPALVVVDSRGRVSGWPHWMAQPMWGRWIALGSEATPPDHSDRLIKLGVICLRFGDDRVDLAAALSALASTHGIERIRVESGGRLNAALLASGLVDELHLLVYPFLAGGTAGPRFLPDLPGRLFGLRFRSAEPRDGGTVLLSYGAG